MAKKRIRKNYPGTMYVPAGTCRLYLKYKGVRHPTHLVDTEYNRQVAELWLRDLERLHQGKQPLFLKSDGTLPDHFEVNQHGPVILVSAPSPAGLAVSIPSASIGHTATWHNGQVPVPASPVPAVMPGPLSNVPVPTESAHGVDAAGVDTATILFDRKEVTTLRHCDVRSAYDRHLDAMDLEDDTRDDYRWTLQKVIIHDTNVISRFDIEEQVVDWKRRESHLGAVSVGIYLRNFKTYCNFLRDKDLLDREVNLKKYKDKGTEKPRNEFYVDYEYGPLIKHFETHMPRNRKVGPYRQVARLLRFLLATGFRIKETLFLYRSNFNRRMKRIELVNKRTRNTEYFPITAEVLAILDEIPKDQDKLFTWKYSSASSVIRIIKRGFQAVGVEPRRGFHTFRKTFADELHQTGVDLYDRQKLLRHRDIRTTVTSYAYTDTERLGKVLKKADSKRKKKDAAKHKATGATRVAAKRNRATVKGSRTVTKTTQASKRSAKPIVKGSRTASR